MTLSSKSLSANCRRVASGQIGASDSGRSANLGRIFKRMPIVGFLLLSACARIDYLDYESYVADIDGLSQLEISTYPANFPESRRHVPFIYRHLETYNRLYFQVFIRNKDQAGQNPHVESIFIHEFSYGFGNHPDTVLITEYQDYFWMQGQPKYNDNYANTEPVLFVPGASITVNIKFTLNGDYYEFEGQMPATRKQRLRPLLLDAFR